MFAIIAVCASAQAYEEDFEAVYEEPYEEVELEAEDVTEVPVGGSGKDSSERFVSAFRFHTGACTVGRSRSDVILTCYGWNFRRPYPTSVFCQTRQHPRQNNDYGWPDQFGCQIIETGRTFVRFRIRRFDNGTGSSGWGQNLRVNLLVIE